MLNTARLPTLEDRQNHLRELLETDPDVLNQSIDNMTQGQTEDEEIMAFYASHQKFSDSGNDIERKRCLEQMGQLLVNLIDDWIEFKVGKVQ